ncbi:PDGLE domain-containing protein [Patescibacteria group bacterium]|nr:PDGLE domain-containing protein [Patescibacteria group bacterium]
MKVRFILIISLLISGALSIFASSYPDGLEKVAEDKDFLESAISWWGGLIPDYAMPGVASGKLATALAGIIGALIVFGLLYLFGFIVNRQRS